MYYGILLNCDVVICGAPQYYIGDYLNTTDYHKMILKSIVKEEKIGIEEINNKLYNALNKYDISNIKFIIHYSKNEHTYQEHIYYLLKDLKTKNAIIEENISNYLNHDEVGEYFKKLLIKIFS